MTQLEGPTGSQQEDIGGAEGRGLRAEVTVVKFTTLVQGQAGTFWKERILPG